MINKEHFFVIAGDCSEWDDSLTDDNPYHSLSFQQEEQHDEGRRSAELVYINDSYIVVSGTPALDEKSKLFEPGLVSKQFVNRSMYECLKWGIEWVTEDPLNREFYMRIPE